MDYSNFTPLNADSGVISLKSLTTPACVPLFTADKKSGQKFVQNEMVSIYRRKVVSLTPQPNIQYNGILVGEYLHTMSPTTYLNTCLASVGQSASQQAELADIFDWAAAGIHAQ